MAFYADTFVFNGTDCSAYDLVLLDIRQAQSDSVSLASGPEISEDFVNRQWKPYFYGVTRPNKLTFQMSVGLKDCRMQAGTFLTRTEIANIMRWLTGPNTYRWMSIKQNDMMVAPAYALPLYQYKCMITDVQLQFIDDHPWGMTFTVTCDSPYAYQGIESPSFIVLPNGYEDSISLTSKSCLEQLFYPIITIDYSNVVPSKLYITNNTTDQELELVDIPSDVTQIVIDGEHRVLRSTPERNLYAGFNFVFVGLARGANSLTTTNVSTAGSGSASPRVILEFTGNYPVDIGA